MLKQLTIQLMQALIARHPTTALEMAVAETNPQQLANAAKLELGKMNIPKGYGAMPQLSVIFSDGDGTLPMVEMFRHGWSVPDVFKALHRVVMAIAPDLWEQRGHLYTATDPCVMSYWLQTEPTEKWVNSLGGVVREEPKIDHLPDEDRFVGTLWLINDLFEKVMGELAVKRIIQEGGFAADVFNAIHLVETGQLKGAFKSSCVSSSSDGKSSSMPSSGAPVMSLSGGGFFNQNIPADLLAQIVKLKPETHDMVQEHLNRVGESVYFRHLDPEDTFSSSFGYRDDMTSADKVRWDVANRLEYWGSSWVKTSVNPDQMLEQEMTAIGGSSDIQHITLQSLTVIDIAFILMRLAYGEVALNDIIVGNTEGSAHKMPIAA